MHDQRDLRGLSCGQRNCNADDYQQLCGESANCGFERKRLFRTAIEDLFDLVIFATQLLNGNLCTTTPACTQAVTITNSGTVPMTISSVPLSGANAGDFTRQATVFRGTVAAGTPAPSTWSLWPR